ncbi:hypothetical protein A3D84_02925 [Candidatus Woesebacteria bacterium RIFCSPHIGHO2_02_FULL_42_20]|uniref:SCP domain-containing protein n=1 Tax=Candidatus Woesebacteria bacterium RIFCSPHIGHO2_12_FULL_41_24 TaxID=1802510 RepID=A0A1F8AS83_9BACT|nr:MAG: hypothetical protein A2W15_03115 [Candidatus Woesebacteria bacterium RBG_16_41_13]OGM29088.1 MAG: hypothetical protein A2873_01960 [Candidatus Woesebacteria bacterium RIFCSPHIGHO2_01_FULL_42_80]OGM34796.1 MAG: hypothetical protein A3D84_02925 [Candidatus Woesebacteria bacterium RIFCSPHIGHO2_02_FULL_42_20]OGM54551.1 MAG: hypothetical protein A3E44_06075 [Candidatus Woesebacteria bacterium RIFCSPHIGHO2_12_FULL_41_24]OGM66742.1 MAG: hypothetical protein A2969_05250 [Candidatus Woesebacteri
MAAKAKQILSKVFTLIAVISLLTVFGSGSFMAGFKLGAQSEALKPPDTGTPSPTVLPMPVATLIPTLTPKIQNTSPNTQTWGGPDLWEAVNKRRKDFGVNELASKSELCTIASIRLNELLELGKLDGHEGFSDMPERRPDLKWIYDKYNLSEFLVSGAQSASEAVSLWENTLGHKKLLNGGEYVWGCIYAQNGFGVAITAY